MKKYYDVIIVGTGIAGLYTALNIDKTLKVLLLSKSSIDSTNSKLAQGGIVSCINPEVHFKDTMRAGHFYNNEETIRAIEDDSKKNIEKLVEYGVNFDRDDSGNLKFTREGGHSESTILYSKDETGKELIRALKTNVQHLSNIDILEDTSLIKILKDKNSISGIVTLDVNENIKIYKSQFLILATGGVGQIYKDTTNVMEITGDGIALAYEIGAKIVDMEFVQFHPTAMYNTDDSRRFLISEAVRGEGGILRNLDGEAFMHRYHELGDIAPRDIVSRSIFNEMQKYDSEFVYLDISHRDPNYIKERFPNIYKHCMSKGIDITRQYIPIAPAEHYIMGGIETDLSGKTNIEGLFACGECASTGFHGANRLASNSLLESVVFGMRVAEEINKGSLNYRNKGKGISKAIEEFEIIVNKTDKDNKLKDEIFSEIEHILRKTMTDHLSIIRNRKDLLKARDRVETLSNRLNKNKIKNKRYFRLKSMIIVSKLIIESAIKREESLGVHFIVKDDRGEEDAR